MRSILLGGVAALCLAAAAPALAQGVPPAVVSDPAPDAAHPPRNAQVLIPSEGSEMNALLFLASGEGPHPTVILLHGLPGNEQNLDLAQAIRRDGWNVLTLHYRGSWGSQGRFSITSAIADGDAAAAFLRDPRVAAKYGIDTHRIVMGGHSMGGLVTAMHASHDRDLAGAFFLDPWNAGADGARWAAAPPAARAAFEAGMDDFGHALAGADPHSIAVEIAAHSREWDLVERAASLTHVPVLVIGAERGGGAGVRAFADAIAQAGGQISGGEMSTDHSFSDHRIAMMSAVIDWLNNLPH